MSYRNELIMRRIDPTTLHWYNKPDLYIISMDKIVLETQPNTRFQGKLNDGKDAVGMYLNVQQDFVFEACLNYRFRNQNDECGIFIHENEQHYITYGLCQQDDLSVQLVCRSFKDGKMDESYRYFGSNIQQFYLRIQKENNTVSFAFGLQGNKYLVHRKLQVEGMDKVGIYAHSYGNSYYDCTFSRMEYLEKE